MCRGVQHVVEAVGVNGQACLLHAGEEGAGLLGQDAPCAEVEQHGVGLDQDAGDRGVAHGEVALVGEMRQERQGKGGRR